MNVIEAKGYRNESTVNLRKFRKLRFLFCENLVNLGVVFCEIFVNLGVFISRNGRATAANLRTPEF